MSHLVYLDAGPGAVLQGLKKLGDLSRTDFFSNWYTQSFPVRHLKGTAFPSSHCAIAVIVVLYAARYHPICFYSPMSIWRGVGRWDGLRTDTLRS